MSGLLRLVTTSLANNSQAYTNALYVNPNDLQKLADASGTDQKSAAEKGVLCSVGEAVFFVR
jgi:hypothetical protein